MVSSDAVREELAPNGEIPGDQSEIFRRVLLPDEIIGFVEKYDFARKRFVDFSLSRVRFSAPASGHTVVPEEIDEDWQTVVTIVFVPHPMLAENQKLAVAREFGMTGDTLVVSVRRALLFYLLDEMRILTAVRNRDVLLAQPASIWVQDLDSVCDELSRMDMRAEL